MAKAKTKAGPKPKQSKTVARPASADERKWQAEDDARTLMRAQEIKSDGARMKRAKAVAAAQVAALNKVAKA